MVAVCGGYLGELRGEVRGGLRVGGFLEVCGVL
jgi:hypothetical protein